MDKDKFLQFIAEILEVKKESITLETRYQSIPQWDSLMHLRLVSEIEEEYRVEIPIDEVPNIMTLADFYKYISQ